MHADCVRNTLLAHAGPIHSNTHSHPHIQGLWPSLEVFDHSLITFNAFNTIVPPLILRTKHVLAFVSQGNVLRFLPSG